MGTSAGSVSSLFTFMTPSAAVVKVMGGSQSLASHALQLLSARVKLRLTSTSP